MAEALVPIEMAGPEASFPEHWQAMSVKVMLPAWPEWDSPRPVLTIRAPDGADPLLCRHVGEKESQAWGARHWPSDKITATHFRGGFKIYACGRITASEIFLERARYPRWARAVVPAVEFGRMAGRIITLCGWMIDPPVKFEPPAGILFRAAARLILDEVRHGGSMDHVCRMDRIMRIISGGRR